ncbi:hypothetical protein P9112_012530 [Eukaryota sp. TZLM1-RC]
MDVSKVYGLDSTKNLEFSTDSIIYAAGNVITVVNPEEDSQNFLTAYHNDSFISCYTVSTNKRYAAVAEFNGERSSLSIWDLFNLKRKKFFTVPELVHGKVISMAFSPDCRVLITLSSAPDHLICYIPWEKGKVSASLKNVVSQNTSLSHLAISPTNADGSLFLVCGNGLFRILRYAPGELSLRLAHGGLVGLKKEHHGFTCAEWVNDDVIIVGTKLGELHLLEKGQYVQSLTDAPLDGKPIVRIMTCSKGFLTVSYSGMYIFELVDNQPTLIRTGAMNNSIQQFALSPSEESFAVINNTSQIPLLYRFSSEELISEENGLLLWKFSNGLSSMLLGLNDLYSEAIVTFSFHPSFTYIAVSLFSKLVILLITFEGFIEVHEFGNLANSSSVEWSKDGSLLAVAHKCHVSILSFSSATSPFPEKHVSKSLPSPHLITSIRAHSTSEVCSLSFNSCSNSVVAGCRDGAVVSLEFNGIELIKKKMFVSENCELIAIEQYDDCVFVLSKDGVLKSLLDFDLHHEIELSVIPTCMCLVSPPSHSNYLAIGSDDGSVTFVSIPLGPASQILTHNTHSQSVFSLIYDCFDHKLISSSLDGSVFEYKFKKSFENQSLLAGCVIVPCTLLNQSSKQVCELISEIDSIQQNHLFETTLRNEGFNVKLREKEEELSEELASEERKFNDLEATQLELNKEHNNQVNKLKLLHNQTVNQMKEAFDARAIHDQNLEEELIKSIGEIKDHHDERVKVLKEEHRSKLTSLFSEFLMRKEEDELVMENMKKTLQELVGKHDTDYSLIEKKIEKESMDLVKEFQSKIVQEKSMVEALVKENEALKAEYSKVEQDLLAKRDEVESLHEEQEKHLAEIEKINKEKASLAREIRERNSTIEEKELRALELKKKNQELGKFRFVLNFKIDELVQELEPYEAQVMECREQIKHMEDELHDHSQRLAELKSVNQDLQMRISATKSAINDHLEKKSVLEELINVLDADLKVIINNLDNPKKTKQSILSLYRYYVTQESAIPGVKVTSVLANSSSFNLHRHLHQTQRTCTTLGNMSNKTQTKFQKDRARLLHENTVLTECLNELRREFISFGVSNSAKSAPSSDQLTREIEMQSVTIKRLEKRLAEVENQRPRSRSKLPPLSSPV